MCVCVCVASSAPNFDTCTSLHFYACRATGQVEHPKTLLFQEQHSSRTLPCTLPNPSLTDQSYISKS